MNHMNTLHENLNLYDTGSKINLRDILRKRDSEQRDPAVMRVEPAADEPFWTAEDIDVRDVMVAAYQRDIKEAKIKSILREGWKPLKMGIIILAKRADGSYYVVDGQHRIVAINRFNGAVPYVQRMVVWQGLTPGQEAAMFAETQDPASRAPILPHDRLHAQREYDESTPERQRVDQIDAILADHGYHLGTKAPTPESRRITGVKAVESVYDDYGPDILATTLAFISGAWGWKETPDAALIYGVARFMVMFPDANYVNLMRRVAKTPMKYWVEDAMRSGELLKNRVYRTHGNRIVRALHADYNTTHHKNPLPPIEEALKKHQAERRSAAAREVRRRQRELKGQNS